MGMEREQEFYGNGNVIGKGIEWKWELYSNGIGMVMGMK